MGAETVQRRWGRAWLACAAAVLAAATLAVAGGEGAGGAAATTSCPGAGARAAHSDPATLESATICLVNEERAARGRAALALDGRLARSARAHSEDMHRRGYFSHTSPSGTTPSERARAAGYPSRVAENILRGDMTPAEAVAYWMEGAEHRDNILDERFRGVGAAYAGGYWTLTFGAATPQARPAARAPGAEDSYPAKLEVLRARVDGGRLDLLADLTARAEGDPVRIAFLARGRRSSFTGRVAGGRVRLRRRLPAVQRAARSGIVEIAYAGNPRVRPAHVRLRAARRPARLRRTLLSLHDGVLRAEGRLRRAARGVVRVRLGYEAPGGAPAAFDGVAVIADGRWSLRRRLPSAARGGGYLTIQYTGYLPRRIRGEQIAKELLAGQSFGR